MESKSEFGFIRLSCGHTFGLDEDDCVIDQDDLIFIVTGYGYGRISAKAILRPYALYVDDYYNEGQLVLDDYEYTEFEDMEYDSYDGIEDFEWDDDPTCICPQCGSETYLGRITVHGRGGSDDEEIPLEDLEPEDNLRSFFNDLAARSG